MSLEFRFVGVDELSRFRTLYKLLLCSTVLIVIVCVESLRQRVINERMSINGQKFILEILFDKFSKNLLLS